MVVYEVLAMPGIIAHWSGRERPCLDRIALGIYAYNIRPADIIPWPQRGHGIIAHWSGRERPCLDRIALGIYAYNIRPADIIPQLTLFGESLFGKNIF